MLRHIVAWNFKDGFTEKDNIENAKKVKASLEELKNSIEEITELNVYIELLPSSTKNVILNSLFEDEDALQKYQVHPKHKIVAEYIGKVMSNRVCLDYYE